MPIPLPPLTTICPHCGWKRTSIPTSDALKLNVDWFCRCPICQYTELETRPASRAEIMRERLRQFLR
ncbi:hypothetical protein [Pseudomonas aeruginosa]|uniref:Uncharacterized protein n=1 Tax=Pseudomonas aeruginosa TaxID=287 RepID=A0AAQ3QZI1_PSEAI|nr:hypothetical protein [Pseudomonas aeruginosa]EIU4789140.1 hypothetical protein [Pseudomonas aeruginosa]MDY1146498.1 hypothetical protein [Pseudomonas aeruginosa]MDY1206767.1 hypothetical protein [Pseudomonas aeruginosa]WOS76262.1 hypothetical protein L4V69_27755 [Pseudomonas aeruginosa]